MRIAYFDAIGGAAGDMVLGSLLDAGLSLDALRAELRKLPLQGYGLRAERVEKNGVAATQFRVDVDAEDHHRHDHGRNRLEHGTSVREIDDLIDRSGLDDSAKGMARRIFRRLGEAEARVHGVSLDEVHFHEVGAVDSIVDIVGACIAFRLLGIEGIYASPLPTGSGTIRTKHGLFPVPAPATLELIAAAGAPTRSSAVQAEQVTPTGAAILTTLATFDQPSMRPDRIGYGSGEADLEIPNVLRVWVGEIVEAAEEEIWVLETNVDDMSPEIAAHAVERALGAGALDASISQIIMKKGRPGVRLEVLCRSHDRERLAGMLLAETPTLGVRSTRAERFTADRENRTVETSFGPVSVKIKRLGGRFISASPEYEDCRGLAEECGVPLVAVYDAALAAARPLLQPEG